MEPGVPAVEAWNINHWTTREVPECFFLRKEKENGCFLFVIQHSDFSCQFSEFFLTLSLDRTPSNLAAARLTGPSHSKGSLGEERNPTNKYYR